MRVVPRVILAMTTACLLLAVSLKAFGNQSSGPTLVASPDEKAIYEAVLRSWLGKEHETQLVNQRLSPPPSASAPENADCIKGSSFSKNPGEALQGGTLSGVTFDGIAVKLVDGNTWSPTDPEQSIVRGNSVDSSVQEAFSRSLISFSQIELSADRNDALVSFRMACGPLCGTGFTLHMHKSSGQWMRVAQCGSYVS